MSRRIFDLGLYEQHFEELAVMYEHRRAWLDDWESTPAEIGELEERMAAHIDGLVLGGKMALDVAVAASSFDDPSSIYAKISVACYAGRFDLVRETLAELELTCTDADVDETTGMTLRKSAADALVHHQPVGGADDLIALLPSAGPHIRPVLAACFGAGRLRGGAAALSTAAKEPCSDPRPMLGAIARIPGSDPSVLFTHLRHDDPAVATAAAIAGLRRRDIHVLDRLVQLPNAAWAAVPLAIASGPALGPLLARAVERDDRGDVLLALGLLGDPAGLDILLEHLHDGVHADVAALGLFVLTGATLALEKPDPDDEATPEGSEEEHEAGDAPHAGSSLIAGSNISTDPDAWTRWMQVHRAALRPGQRYRLGVLGTPATDFAAWSGTSLPGWLRQLLVEEWVIRYGVETAYEVDLPLARQRGLLAQLRAWVAEPGAPFHAGTWYFRGSPVR